MPHLREKLMLHFYYTMIVMKWEQIKPQAISCVKKVGRIDRTFWLVFGRVIMIATV